MGSNFIPSTGFSHKASLDATVRPYLGRVSRLVAFDYLARGRIERLPRGVDVLMTPGSSKAMLKSARVSESSNGLGQLGWNENERFGDEAGAGGEQPEDWRWLSPDAVLDVQRSEAQKAWVLDLPCSPETDAPEGDLRVRLTLANARWARAQEVAGLELWGPVVGWDEASIGACAREVAAMGYRTLVMSGVWGWAKQFSGLCCMVESVRAAVDPGISLHLSGVGSPDMARRLSELGVTSLDSAAYVRAADRGVQWDADGVLADSSQIEKVHMAIANAETLGRVMEEGWQAYRKSLVRRARGR